MDIRTIQEAEQVFNKIKTLLEAGDHSTARVILESVKPDQLPKHLHMFAGQSLKELYGILNAAGMAKNSPAGLCSHMKQIGFSVGTGRCGTTILSSLLNAHSRVCVPPELSFLVNCYGQDLLFEKALGGEMVEFQADDFVRLIGDFCPFDLDRFIDLKSHFEKQSYPQLSVTQVARKLFDEICRNQGKEVLIEQTTWYGLELHSIKKMFPEMKVIHVVRDARDVAISAARTGWWHMGVHENIERWEREVNKIHRFGLDYPTHFLEIRYEDLIADPTAELSRVLNMFGLVMEPKILEGENVIDYFDLFKEDISNCHSPAYKRWKKSGKENGRGVLFSDSVFAWRKSAEHDFSKLSPKVRETLLRYGYST